MGSYLIPLKIEERVRRWRWLPWFKKTILRDGLSAEAQAKIREDAIARALYSARNK